MDIMYVENHLILMCNGYYVCRKSPSNQECVDSTGTADHSVFCPH